MATKSRSRTGKRKSSTSKKAAAAKKQAQNQMRAIVLFALGLLLLAIVFIKGEQGNFWNVLHRSIFGLFGVGGVFVAVTLLYLAILITAEKPWKGRAFLCFVSVTAFCGALQIFVDKTALPSFDDGTYVRDMLMRSIISGMDGVGGGLLGTAFGFPLLWLCGQVGSGIIIVILLGVLLMLLSGTTLIGMLRAANRPITAVSDTYAAQLEKQQARKAQVQEKRVAAPPAPKKPPSAQAKAAVAVAAAGAEAAKQPAAKRAAAKAQTIDIPLDGEVRADQPQTPPPAPEVSAEAVPQPPAPPEPETKKPDIDISLDDDFRASKTGGFSLGVAGHVEQTDPTLDELVNKVASVHQTQGHPAQISHEQHASEPAEEPMTADEKLAYHLNLPPDIDQVEGLEDMVEDDPFFEKRKQKQHDEQIRLPGTPEIPGAPVAHTAQPAAPTPPPAPVVQEAPKVVRPYRKPPFSLLRVGKGPAAANGEELKANAQLLVDTLASFGVQTRVVDISRGPAVTRYELQPSAGVKISRITGLADDIALNLAAAGVRIEAPIPNKAAVGIEVPNKTVSAVTLREIVDSEQFLSAKSKLTVALGRDIAGNLTLADIGKMPHLLIAGSTGSGKSVCINSIIMSLIFQATPEEVRFLMIDPKVVELGVYNGIPHLLVPVVTDPKKAAGALSWAVGEMLKRYKLFADNSVRDLKGYNALAQRTEGMESMSQVVIIIDELADLMMAAPNEIEDYICRLAQMARAAGMHLIIATQRPSVDVITGVIKANIPSRIAFAVSSQIDSRTILDMGGAEKLLGRGDMLFNPIGSSKPIRVQGCFVTDEEIEAVISFVKNDAIADYDQQIVQQIDSHVVAGKGAKSSAGASSASDGDDTSGGDEMLMAAIECVVESGSASTSLLQRRLKLGYARAARIVDEMESRGIVGPFEGSKPRQVLLSPERLAELKLAQHRD